MIKQYDYFSDGCLEYSFEGQTWKERLRRGIMYYAFIQ